MRTLNFCYRMTLDFSEPVSGHQFTLRMLPKTDERQQVTECEVRLTPECELFWGEDAFENRYVYGEVKQEHTKFAVEVFGKAVIESGIWIPASKEEKLNRYRYPSRYTKTGEKLKGYFTAFRSRQTEKGFAFAEVLMHRLYEDIEYRQGVTNIHTTAEEALSLGQGVCQDYAHIMIALCRMAGIPARYVVGMMSGEGYSHAWVEVCADGFWYGMDPTNNRMADDTYVKISHGRDYQDCIVNRGVFRGWGTQTQTVKVVVEEEQ